MDGEDVAVGLFVLYLEIGLGSVVAEPSRLDTEHVDSWLTFYYPLGQLPAGTATSGNAKRMAFVEPEILQAPGWANDRISIGGVTDSAVVNFFDADFRECRHSIDGGLDMGLKAVEIFLEQLVLNLIVGAVYVAAWRTGLVGAEKKTAGLLT